MKIMNILPWKLRNIFDLAHRKHALNKAMDKFLQNPEQCFNEQSSLLNELFYGWGNEAWSAENEYLLACIKQVFGSINCYRIQTLGKAFANRKKLLPCLCNPTHHWYVSHK